MISTQEAAAKDRNEAVAEQSAVMTQNNAAEAEMNLLSPGRGVRAPSGVNVTAEMQNILGAMPQPTSSRHIHSEAVACARNPAQPEDQRQQQNRLIRNAALAANLGTNLKKIANQIKGPDSLIMWLLWVECISLLVTRRNLLLMS